MAESAAPSPPASPHVVPAAETNLSASVNGGGPQSQNQDLWGSILDSVAGKRGVVTKNLVVLGGPKTGKSTLIERLSSPTGDAPATGNTAEDDAAVLDLGLSYVSLDFGDEADEETIARLGVYQLPSALPPYPSLLPLALSKTTLLDSLVLIVLDWERPWEFLRDLRAWMGVLEGVLKGKGVGEGWEGAEGRDRLESFLRHYSEPNVNLAASASASTSAGASSQLDTDSPLPPGVLTSNLGLGIVIVCTKADQINVLERDKDFKDEQFDYVQQTLRTIALKYGASLFFTSHSRPQSFSKLRSYVLHRLFSQTSLPSTTPATTSTSQSTPLTVPTASRAFPFPHRANFVDRDQVFVPTGWDSWGKIKIIRDRFEPDVLGRGWEADMERERERLAGTSQEGQEEDRFDEEGRKMGSALKMFEEVVVDLDSDDQPINLSHSRVEAQDEQDFLKTHYETLQKDREKDPRTAFASRPNNASHGGGSSLQPNGSDSLSSSSSANYKTSVVGPMGSSSLSLPSVERALERDPDDVTARLAKMVRKDNGIPSRTPTTPGFPSLSTSTLNHSTSSGSGVSGGGSISPALVSPGASAGGQAQNEVLANFFQSLLAARSTGTGANRPPPGVQSLATSSTGAGVAGTSGGAKSNSPTTGSGAEVNGRS